jgi:putative methanogenesis marker 13 metalloprotein
MIIGEDLPSAIDSAGITTPTIAVDIHAGYPENIAGVIATLEAAESAGWISGAELSRQRYLLKKANEVERLRGAASAAYIEPSRGDVKHLAARDLLECARSGNKGVAVLNAKKETAYMFADELIALHDTCPDADITYIANLADRGLPKVRADAKRILDEMTKRKVSFEVIGALDEYGANGDILGQRIRELSPSFALLCGVPHAIPAEYTKGVTCFSITNGPRQVEPLRALGHQHVIVEIDLHPKTLGVTDIVESEFGAVIRSLA